VQKERQIHVRRKKTWLFILFKQEKISTRSYYFQNYALTITSSSLFHALTERETRSATHQSALLPLVSRGAFTSVTPDFMGLGLCAVWTEYREKQLS